MAQSPKSTNMVPLFTVDLRARFCVSDEAEYSRLRQKLMGIHMELEKPDTVIVEYFHVDCFSNQRFEEAETTMVDDVK